MKAGKAIIWNRDEDGRIDIAYQDTLAVAYKTTEQFKLQALSRAGIKAEDYDPEVHEIVLVPFGG